MSTPRMTLYEHAALYDLLDKQDDVDFYTSEALKTNGPCLDLACGTGRLLIPLAQAGVKVTGLEQSPQMLAKAREKVEKLSRETQSLVNLVQGDMRSFDLEERFSLIVIAFESFLHLLTVEDQLAALTSVRKHLVPDGRLIVDFNAGHFHIDDLAGKNAQKRRWFDLPDPESGSTLEVWGKIDGNPYNQHVTLQRWVRELDANGDLIGETHLDLTSRVIFRWEFEHLLLRRGFAIRALYGTFDRAPMSSETRKLIGIAELKE